MNSIFFDEIYNKKYIEKLDNDDFYEAEHEIVQDAQSEVAECESRFKSLCQFIDSKLSNTIEKINKVKKDAKVSISYNLGKAKQILNTDTADMITCMNKYVKQSRFGKATFTAANILGWVPPFTPIPGAAEMIYTVAEIINYLLEIKRVFSGSNRSAINDFINKCKKEEQIGLEELENIQLNITRNKFINNISTFFYKFMKALTILIDQITLKLRSMIIDGYNENIYKPIAKAGHNINAISGEGKNIVTRKIKHIGQNMERKGNELQTNSDKALEAHIRMREKRNAELEDAANKIARRSQIKN